LKRILFMSQPGSIGHVVPLAGISEELKSMGHHVGWIAMTDARAKLFQSLGVEVVRTKTDAPSLAALLSEVSWIHDDRRYRETYEWYFVEAVRPLVEPVRDAIRNFKPHVMVCDALCFVAHIAAHLEGVPYAGADTTTLTLGARGLDFRFRRLMEGVLSRRDQLFRDYGMTPEFGFFEVLAPTMNFVFATEALIGADTPLPASVRLVGPTVMLNRRLDEPSRFPWDRLTSDRPLVVFSLGTLYGRVRREISTIVMHAAHRLGLQLVMAGADPNDPGMTKDLVGDVIAAGYIPMLQLLERASVLVSHGGFNSVTEALYFGVPMLVAPIDGDQPVNGNIVQTSGAGIAIDPDDLSVNLCTKALRELVTGTRCRAFAKAIQENYRGQDGSARAAELVLSLA
jgi:zeaxanthin glucosyltransferase